MAARWSGCLLLIGCASAGAPATPNVDAPPGSIDAPVVSIDAPPSACDLALAGQTTGFESASAGWTHAVLDGASAAGWPLDEWQLGTASSGPGSCHGGTKCWATRLDANYTSCERAALTSPTIDLSACAGQSVKLKFWSWHDFWTGTVAGKTGTWFDGGLLEVLQLPAAAVTSTFRFRFAFSSGVSFANNDAEANRAYTRSGWYIDDITFSAM